ncbi:unnamed protein product, partial [Staurois parvus]
MQRFSHMRSGHPAVTIRVPTLKMPVREDCTVLDRGTGKMTADLWGGRGSGYLNLTGTRSYFRRVFFLSYLFLYPAARCLPGFCSVGACRTAGCPV